MNAKELEFERATPAEREELEAALAAIDNAAQELSATGRRVRLLLVEDSDTRHEVFRSWLPAGIILVRAPNAGAALGILARDPPKTYAGLLLDHDLVYRPFTDGGGRVNGAVVARAVKERLVRERPPILVHSMNEAEGPSMAAFLEDAGFPTTRFPFGDLTGPVFLKWLHQVVEEASANLEEA